MDPEIMRRAGVEHQMAVYRGDFIDRPYHPSHQLNEPYATPKYSANIRQEEAKKRFEGRDKNKGYGIKLKKILGFGGFGIAALVEHTGRDNAVKQCVMKLELARHQGLETIKKEEEALNKFKGAKHIVQILDITNQIKAERNASNARNAMTENPTSWEASQLDQDWDIQKQRTRDFVLTEFAEHGDLNTWLNKACRSGRPWPNKALWWLFRCLVKGLVGMGYPPIEHHTRIDRGWDPNDPIEEYIPQGVRRPQQTCHFDLEAMNVLVDSDEGHGDFPIFKINDFGGIEYYDRTFGNRHYFNRAHFFKRRWRGKRWCLTPEQFTAEWKDVSYYDEPDNVFLSNAGRRPRVAGNYGMHSNIYQVGVMMWSAITRCTFYYYGTVTFNGIETYGGALQDERFNNVDLKLREAIMTCMAHDPSHRPTLADLLSRIEQALQRPGLESDHDTYEWAREFFSTPRVPGDEPEEVQDTEMADGNDDNDEEPVLSGQWGGVKRECPPDDDHEDDHRYRSQRKIGESPRTFRAQRLSGGDFVLSGGSQTAPQQLIFDALRDDQPASPSRNAQQQQGQGGAAVPPQQQQQQQQQKGQGGSSGVPSHLRHVPRRQMQQQQQQHPPSGQRQPPTIYGQQPQQEKVQRPRLNANAPVFQPQQQFQHNPQPPYSAFPNVFYQQAPQQPQPQQQQQQQQQQFGHQNVFYQNYPPQQQQQQQLFGNQNVVYEQITPQQLPGGQQVYGYTLRFPQQGHQPQQQ